jgi:hypothetical protein
MTRAIVRPLREALAALPTEPNEIARVFAELGIKGRRHSPGCCPVANYLKAEAGVPHIGVSPRMVWTSTMGRPIDLPVHVREFVDRFDRRRYPELVADGAA